MAANRGKVLEKEFKSECVKRSAYSDFEFYRFPDAHAGSYVATPSDFMTVLKGVTRYVECKETKFDNRIPYTNFKADQVARLHKWSLAGVDVKVLIKHTASGLYRVLDIAFFLDRDMSKGSWFLDSQPTCENIGMAFNLIHGT